MKPLPMSMSIEKKIFGVVIRKFGIIENPLESAPNV
jgi:hypothetical protein